MKSQTRIPSRAPSLPNFLAWRGAIASCIHTARASLRRGTDIDALAAFVLTVMEGGVMQALALRTIGPYDISVAQLRNYFALPKEAA